MSTNKIYSTDDWVFAEGLENSMPTFARYRAEVPDMSVREVFSTLVMIEWQFAAQAGTGFPDPTTRKAMDSFEEYIDSQFELDGNWAILVATITRPGLRQWRLYTSEKTIFLRKFNALFDQSTRRPVSLRAFQDSDWQALQELQGAKPSN